MQTEKLPSCMMPIFRSSDWRKAWNKKKTKYPTTSKAQVVSSHCTGQSNGEVSWQFLLKEKVKGQHKFCSKSSCKWCHYDNSNPCETSPNPVTNWHVMFQLKAKATCIYTHMQRIIYIYVHTYNIYIYVCVFCGKRNSCFTAFILDFLCWPFFCWNCMWFWLLFPPTLVVLGASIFCP